MIRPVPARFAVGVGSAVVFALVFLFRFLSAEFTNDHFMHLVEGRQVLAGEWPVRDFFDFGLPFQVLTSTVTLLASGHNLYGEALVTVAFIAAGVACTFALSALLTGSMLLATGAAVIAAVAAPRLYSYPKAFFYVAALCAAWCYARRPDTRRLVALGWIVSMAFYFRHDHGIYIGLSSIVLFLVTHWTEPRVGAIAFARYAGLILLVVAPFLLYVQVVRGLAWYVADLAPAAQAPATASLVWLPIDIDRSAPWLTVDPPAERRFHVRWLETLDAATRARLEARFHLIRRQPDGPATWSYVTEDEGASNIRALINNPNVIDTNGIDRRIGELAVRELWYEWLQRRVPLLRIHLLPGLFRDANALPVFYVITWAIPLMGLLVLAITVWRRDIARAEAAVAAMAVLLSFIAIQTLVRGSPDSRLPDVTTVIAVIGAWTAVRMCRGTVGLSRYARTAIVVLLWSVTAWSAATNAHTGEALNASRLLTGPIGVIDRYQQMRARLQRRPIDTWTDDESGYRGLTRYVFACTAPDDRFLVTWFEPIMYFYAERNFAGAHVFFDGGWQDSIRDQQVTVDRLTRQRVPLIVVRDEFELMFRKYFPLVATYMDENYVKTEPTENASQLAGYQVWSKKGLQPVRTYERLGLPCYR